jgi:orotidine-5'-phosphate decarboxylase
MTSTISAPFTDRLAAAQRAARSSLCIGLDPEPRCLPSDLASPEGILTFCRAIVEATSDMVCAYKPNLAFFERWGAEGWRVLESLIASIPPHIPVIADAKRGDIGNTTRGYAEAIFDRLGAVACTASPYLGVDAAAPLLDYPGGFAFLLCRTSNPGAAAVQDLLVDGEPLHARIIRLFQPWLAEGRAGLVIGAREQTAFAWAARLAPQALLLVPGIGVQGGTAAELAAALSPAQAGRVVVSASRAIIHADSGPGFATAARAAAIAFRDDLRAALSPLLQQTSDAPC